MPFEVKQADDGSFYYVIKGANGEVVATSETFERKADAERAIGDVRNIVQRENGGVNERSDNDS